MSKGTPPPKPLTEQQLLGQALKALREEQGRTQEQAAEALGVQTTTWQRYEWGMRDLSYDKLGRIAEAIDVSREDVLRKRAEILGNAAPPPIATGLGEVQRRPSGFDDPFVIPLWGRVQAGQRGPQVFASQEPEEEHDVRTLMGPSSRLMRVAGESMTGYADSGAMVVYDTRRFPRRGRGAVVEFASGEMLLKLYVETRDDQLVLEELHPTRRELSFPLADVKGVYAVRWRED